MPSNIHHLQLWVTGEEMFSHILHSAKRRKYYITIYDSEREREKKRVKKGKNIMF